MEEEKPIEQIEPQPVNVSPVAPNVPLPPTPQKAPLKKTLKIVLIIIITVGVLGLAGITFVVFSVFNALHSASNECSNGRTQLFSNEQAITDQFNKLVLIPDQPNVNADVTKQQGDCVDSLPTIFATKTYIISTTAGIAFDEMSSALTKAGYTASRDSVYAPDDPCQYQDKPYKFTNINPNRDINITMSCTQNSVKGQGWRQIPVTKATAGLTVDWEYPAK